MRFTKINLLTFLSLLLMASTLQAQKVHHGGKTVHTKSRYNYNTIKMSRSKSKIVCPIFEDTGYPYQAIGIKLGDPFGITYKYYPSKRWGIGVDFGRAASGLYSRYYSEIFSDYTQPDTIDLGESVTYYSHKVKSDWVGELKALYYMDADKISPGLRTYGGLGCEFRSLSINYDYQVRAGGEDQIEEISRDRFSMGVEAVLGIEYSYFKLPISAFMELEYYIDVIKDPGWRKVQGGAGLRYVF